MQLIQPSTTLEMKNILTASFIAVVLALATQSPEVNAASIGVNTENVLAERGPAKYCTASVSCNSVPFRDGSKLTRSKRSPHRTNAM